MRYVASQNKTKRARPGKVCSAALSSFLLIFSQTIPALGNPTGGAVVAGSATIGAAGKTLTINQSSRNAIISWQQFSIANGELTKFLVPSSSAATLNRVTGGNPSLIYGSLQSNGAVFLINPSGIVVGPSGRIDTASFLGSTLDVSNDEFLKGGDMHFTGSSNAAVDNEGSIQAVGGSVYLLANQVSNNGSIAAPAGSVGLAAASNVLFQQSGDEHLFVQPTPAGTTRAVGVTNSGTVRAASAELRAAGGNAYALAINNSGAIAATGYKKINGQVYLTSEGGSITNSGRISAKNANGNGGKIVMDGSGASTANTVLNSGTLDASATAAKGQGGSVLVKNTGGMAIHSGSILAEGGVGGVGGNAEISGTKVGFTGSVDLTASHGKTGNLLLDPTTLDVITGGTGTVTGGQNDSNASTIDPTTVESALSMANLTLNADTNITVTNGITWTSANTLTFSTNTAGSTININAPISGVNGGLNLTAAAPTDSITTGSSGSVNVSSFILESGSWSQNSASLPAFTASNDFEIEDSSTFLRVTGGNGSAGSPYQIVDVYGLQGLASPSGNLLTSSADLMNNIDATGTPTWNSGAGFVPIGAYDGDSQDAATYSGTFNGQGFTVNGLFINTPDAASTGFFGDTASAAMLENFNLTNINITGGDYVAGVVGVDNGGINNVGSSGSVTGSVYVGGLIGNMVANLNNDYTSGSVTGNYDVGGVAGLIQGGSVNFSYSTATVTGTSGSDSVGGLVGENDGTISDAYSTGAVSGTSDVGGLVGYNNGSISTTYSTGAVSSIGGEESAVSSVKSFSTVAPQDETPVTTVGGLVGTSTGSVADSYYSTDGSGQSTGIGDNEGTITYLGVAATSVTGLTLAQMHHAANFDSAFNFTTTWTTNGDTTTPELIGVGTTPPAPPPPPPPSGEDTLSGTAYTDSGTTDAADVTVDLIFDGSVLATTTSSSSGAFTFDVSSSDLTSGVLLTDMPTIPAEKGDTFYQANSPASVITGVDLFGSTLQVMADVASNAALKQTIGSLTGNGIDYSVTGSNLSTASGANVSILSRYTLDGNITATGGMFSTGASSFLNGSDAATTLTGQSVALAGTFGISGALNVVSTAGNITLNGVGTTPVHATAEGINLNAAGSVQILNSFLSLASGNLVATGVGYASTTSSESGSDGVDVFSSVIDGLGGNITLHGTGGYYYDGELEVICGGSGVSIGDSTVATTGAGSISVTGVAGVPGTITSFDGLGGVTIDGSSYGEGSGGSTLSVVQGSLSINGSVTGGKADNGIFGVDIDEASQVMATGNGGSVSVTGNSSGSTAFDSGETGAPNIGVLIGGDAVVSASTGGSLTLHGTGGTVNSSSASNYENTGSADGVLIDGGAQLSTSTGSSLAITGVGGAAVSSGNFTGTADGVVIGGNSDDDSATSLTVANNGSLAIHGTGGAINTVHASTPEIGDVPSAQGVSLQAGATLAANGNAAVAITGAGGTVTAGTGLVSSAIGVDIGTDDEGAAVTVSSNSGSIHLTGTGGAAPNLGIGVTIRGIDGGTASVTSNSGNISISGQGGSGYVGSGNVVNEYVPNYGTAIVDHATVSTSTGAININGIGSAHSYGVAIQEVTDDPSLDSAPVAPVVAAGGAFTATSSAGGIYLDTPISAHGGDVGDAPLTVEETGGNLVLGPNAKLTDSGVGNNITLVAGTRATDASYIINNSSLGAGVLDVSNGANYYLYSSDPTYDQLGGITAAPSETIYNANYPSSSPAAPSGNGALLYYVAAAGDTGYTPSGSSAPPPPPSTPEPTGGEPNDPDGSNVVPPATVPQNSDVEPQGPDEFGGTPGALGYTGNGIASETGGTSGGLADSSGNSGQVGAGDAAQLNNGELNNVANPGASSALAFALGPAVHTALIDALGELIDWQAIAASNPSVVGSGQETTLGAGDAVEIGSNGVQKVPLSQAPKALQNALGNGVLQGLPGSGH